MTELFTSQSHVSFLDVLRGLAALTVFVFHAISVTSEPFATFSRQQFDLGYCGVEIFFFCSGFIIPLTIERQQSATRFLVRRVFRIYPLYWFSLAVYLCYYLTGHAMPGSVTPADWQAHPFATVLVNAVLLQHLLHFPNLLSTSWTLTYELTITKLPHWVVKPMLRCWQNGTIAKHP